MAENPVDVLSTEASERVRSFWYVPAKFALHTVVGTSIFAITTVPAILLDVLVKTLERIAISVVVIYGVKFAEYTLFGTDMLLFLVFLAKTGWSTAKEI